MRQVGILAAAGIFALSNNIHRLEKDHENALTLAMGLSGINKIQIDLQQVQTNIIFADIKEDMNALCDFLKKENIIIDKSNNLRLVTHMDISTRDIESTIKAFKAFFGQANYPRSSIGA